MSDYWSNPPTTYSLVNPSSFCLPYKIHRLLSPAPSHHGTSQLKHHEMATQNPNSTVNGTNTTSVPAPRTSSNSTVTNALYPTSQHWALPAPPGQANLLLEDYETQEEFERAMLLDRMRKNARQTIAYAPFNAECEWASKKWAHWFTEAYDTINPRMTDEAMQLRLQWLHGVRTCNKGKGCNCAGIQEELRREERMSKEERARRRLHKEQEERNEWNEWATAEGLL
jgi:hypothetical protein